MMFLYPTVTPIVYLLSAVNVIVGIKMMSRVRTARRGVMLAVIGVLAAVAITVATSSASALRPIGAGVLVGAVGGGALAVWPSLRAVTPAIWGGFAAVSAALTGLAYLQRGLAVAFTAGPLSELAPAGRTAVAVLVVVAGGAGLAAATFVIASVLRDRARSVTLAVSPVSALAVSLTGGAEVALGYLLGNAMLIMLGGLLATSGIAVAKLLAAGRAGRTAVRTCDAEEAAMALEGASRVAIVPGYGMAVAQAQHAVHEAADVLARRGAEVLYVVHPYAGRIPGHMNVLLDEVNVPHEMIRSPEEAAQFLESADAAIVVGANDVVNPTAGDPNGALARMPRVDLSRAGTVLVVKRSLAPGFTGVANPLFAQPNVNLLVGDAKRAMQSLVTELKANAR